MRNLILAAAVGLAGVTLAVPSQAQVAYFHAHGTTSTLPSNSVVRANFDGINGGTFSGAAGNYGIASTNSNTGGTAGNTPIRRPLDATGNFAYVVGNGATGGKYTISFAPAQVFTFIFGSLNPANALTLNFAGGTSRTFMGGQLAGLAAPAQANGQEGRFFYDARAVGGAAGSVVSAIFSSGIGATFEFDSIATAAPEPAIWAMLIVGFGLIGSALRARPSRKAALA